MGPIAELKRRNVFRVAIDAGFRESWWYEFDYSPAFDSIRDDPEFQALRARVAAEIAEQLARVNASADQSFVN